MSDWSSLYNLDSTVQSITSNNWYIIGIVLALIGAIVVAAVFIRSENRAYYTGWMKRISIHVNFERYIIPLILKFLYVFSALAAVINGIITMFTSSFWLGLVITVLAPIGIRMAYELIMMLFSIHDGIMETNRLLRGGNPSRERAPRQPHYGRTPEYGEDEPAMPPQLDPRGEHVEPQPPEQPKHYPGGYDPMRRR